MFLQLAFLLSQLQKYSDRLFTCFLALFLFALFVSFLLLSWFFLVHVLVLQFEVFLQIVLFFPTFLVACILAICLHCCFLVSNKIWFFCLPCRFLVRNIHAICLTALLFSQWLAFFVCNHSCNSLACFMYLTCLISFSLFAVFLAPILMTTLSVGLLAFLLFSNSLCFRHLDHALSCSLNCKHSCHVVHCFISCSFSCISLHCFRATTVKKKHKR